MQAEVFLWTGACLINSSDRYCVRSSGTCLSLSPKHRHTDRGGPNVESESLSLGFESETGYI